MQRPCAASLLLCSLLACGGDPTGPAVHEPPAPKPRQVCGVDGFCWDAPLPQGGQLSALWASAWNDVWAGGSDGLFHFDGTSWAVAPLPGGSSGVGALWGSSAQDVWAAGDSVFHCDGHSWSEVAGLPAATDASYLSVTGSGPRDVWLLRDTGGGKDERHAILHFDGASWTTQYGPADPTLSALWSPGPGAAWAVGIDLATKGSLALRLASGSWTPVATGGPDPLSAVWGSGAGDVWAVGGSSALHWNGSAWSRAPLSLASGAPLRSLAGSGPADVWAGGAGTVLHWDGAAWSPAFGGKVPDDRLVRALVSTGPSDAWAAGDAGLLLHRDGTAWSSFAQGTTEYLDAVYAATATDAWAAGGHGLALHFDGSSWSAVATPTADPLYALWGSDGNDVWAVGASGDCQGFILHWNGIVWQSLYGPAPSTCFSGVWGTGPGDVWAIAYRQLLHFDGAAWSASGPSDVWRAVWASSPTDVWALQDSTLGGPNAPGSVYHYQGAKWSLSATGSTAQLRAIWGSGPHDVWIAADDSTSLLHWDGTSWSEVATPLPDSGVGTLSLWGTGPSDAWLGGSGAPLLRWDGSAWSAPDGAEQRSVSGISGAGGAVFAVGPDGAIWAKQH